MAMTPAHDAFTLNNRYHSRRMSRSPSPSSTAVSKGINKLTRRGPRRLSQSLHGIGESEGLDTRPDEKRHDVPKRGQAQHQNQNKIVDRRPRAKAPQKIDWEIPRKTLHASIGFLVIPLYTQGYTARPVSIILTGAVIVIAATDALRLNNLAFERLYERVLGFLMRDSEKHKINGVVWYILGVLFSLTVYPLDVAIVSILILSWADTTASTFGRLFGPLTPALPARIPILCLPLARRKSLAGFIAATFTASAVAFTFWGWIAPLRNSVVADAKPAFPSEAIWTWDIGGWLGLGLLSITTGLIGGVAEALDIDPLDDNLTLPIISGGLVWGVIRGLSYFFSESNLISKWREVLLFSMS